MQKIKYSRTFNFPWSESNSSDDVWLKDCKQFEGRYVVMTEKMDGECTTVYPDGTTHARSVDSLHHPSRSMIKQYAAEWAYKIPTGHRICGENVYAYHSIFYTELPSYFLVFGIYDEKNRCISWERTVKMCEVLGLHTVPIIYQGIWDEAAIRNAWVGNGRYPTFESKNPDSVDLNFPQDFIPCKAEGYVVRLQDQFHYDDFKTSCAKYVRAEHVKTNSHWMERKPFPNLLAVS